MTVRDMPRLRLTAQAAMLIAACACTPTQAGAPNAGAGDPERGERAFQQCYACHSVDPEEIDLPGPNLAGVLGRRAGTWARFEYSPAMRAAGRERGLVWTRATLDAYLTDPQAFLPGTSMAYVGLREPSVRADVIAYLARSGGKQAR